MPFALGGPEVPVATGLAGAGYAELYIQPILGASTVLSFVSAAGTYIADTKSGTTVIEQGKISSSTANSLTIATAGAKIPEAFINLSLSTVAVTNDFGFTSFPWPIDINLNQLR